MGKPIEQGGGHLGVAEDAGPLAEAEVVVLECSSSNPSQLVEQIEFPVCLFDLPALRS